MNHQTTIINYLKTVETATLSNIYNNIDKSYYANWQKHVGAIMSRLVKGGKVIRVKKGVFKLNNTKKEINEGLFNELK